MEYATISKYTAWISGENPQLFYCVCDGRSRPKVIDLFGHHLLGCKIGADAIRLHDEVVAVVAKFLGHCALMQLLSQCVYLRTCILLTKRLFMINLFD